MVSVPDTVSPLEEHALEGSAVVVMELLQFPFLVEWREVLDIGRDPDC